jgi:SAM-dependent methyltransferase
MTDELAARYDAVPYRHGAIPDTHPARLGAIARLHGLPAAAPERCRVLELGCGEGMNLLPLAERFPGSEFVGVDFSATAITHGEAARSACSLGNAQLLAADLRTWEPEPESFDYIIAHGLYSWVPDEVKERVLSLCRRALRPHGLAYISYNTLPGWGLPGALRGFLLEQTASPTGSAQTEVEQARAILTALGQANAGQPSPYNLHLQSTVEDMLRKPPELFFHDDLAAVNDPCTFTTFTRRAAAHELHYLAEARYATMHWEYLPATIRAPFDSLELDFMRRQQFMDVLFQRWIRGSILSRAALPADRPVFPESIRTCALSLRMKIDGPSADLRPGVPLRLLGQNSVQLEFTESAEKALIVALVQSGAPRQPYEKILTLANAYLEKTQLPLITDDTAACALLYRLFSLDGLDLLLAGDGTWLTTSPEPAPSPLMRYQAQRGTSITNRWHEPIGVTEPGRQWFLQTPTKLNPGAHQAGFLV